MVLAVQGGTLMAKPILDDDLWALIEPHLLHLRYRRLGGAARLDPSRCLANHPSHPSEPFARSRQDRLVACRDRFQLSAGGFWGDQTGPNPTDRSKAGSKHHVLTDGQGIPLAAKVTAANRHDI